jgi:hypothetical protein
MPFTLAHPAAAIPLRRYLPLSALVVGALSPDLEYPFRLVVGSRFSHTLPGILYFCVPIGLIFLWIFHQLIKGPSVLLLPGFVRQRVEPRVTQFSFWPASRLLLITIAIAIGAITHVVWDSFTHEHGWFVESWPALQASLMASRKLQIFKLLQYGTSILGLLWLSYCFYSWLLNQRNDEPQQRRSLPERVRRRIVAAIVLLTCAVAICAGLWSAVQATGLRVIRVFVVQSSIGAMIAFAGCILLYSLFMKLTNSRVTAR